MAKISVQRNHNLPDTEVRELAESLASELQQEYGLESCWNGDCAEFKRSGVSGTLQLKPGQVSIKLKLGMMMSAFASTIEKELNKALDKKLG